MQALKQTVGWLRSFTVRGKVSLKAPLYFGTTKKEIIVENSLKLHRFREIVYRALVQKRLKMAWRSEGSSNEDLISQLQGRIIFRIPMNNRSSENLEVFKEILNFQITKLSEMK